MRLTLISTLLLICPSFYTQDIHFSQFYRTPLLLNPANTGSSEYDVRLTAIARNQWQSIPVSYNSLGVSGDINIPFKLNRDKIGVGLTMVADRAGDSRFTTLQGSLSSAYHLVTGGENYMVLSLGGAVNFYQRRYDPYALTYDEQFNGDYFDPSLPITEQFDRLNLQFFDFGLGINYQQMIIATHSFNIGASMQHIVSRDQNFLRNSTNTLLERKYNAYINGEFIFYKNLGFIPQFFYQYQDKKYETIAGAGLSINLSKDKNERSKIKLGTNFRMGDAFIPWFQWEGNNVSLQASYDANTSPLRIASNSYGGVEFSIGYLFNFRAEKEKHHDHCPYIWF